MTVAIVFPGQGSQSVGMGQDLAKAFPEAQHVFQEVDDALGYKLSQIIFEGPQEDLTRTQNTQPALMAVSMAVMRVLELQANIDISKFALAAGHSLGQYSALAAANSLSIAEAARLLKIRGESMQKAVPEGKGAMVAVLGVDLETVEKVADEAAAHGICAVANDNCPGQVVLSGEKVAIDQVAEIAKAHGVKRCIPLPVSAPFHCTLMQPAAEAMDKALSTAELLNASIPIIDNTTVKPITDGQEMKNLLVKQVTGQVRWRETIEYFQQQGIERVFEIGAGKVLTGLFKKTAPEIVCTPIGTPEDIEEMVKGF
jgi:[acyl-carrier-protein] S-malonyltransferase